MADAPAPALAAAPTVAPPTCPLISPHASSSGLQLALHPLALLTISDYITRHALRKLGGPIIGALIGTQNGREVAIEHAYEVVVLPPDDPSAEVPTPVIDASFFTSKLRLFKETHPSLDLLGWFATTPSAHFHPLPWHLGVHTQVLAHNESPIMLLLNPAPAASIGGKLPLALYESVYEADGAMLFVPLKYVIETGEAEMIGVDVVARGGGNATETEAPSTSASASAPSSQASSSAKGKGKEKAAPPPPHPPPPPSDIDDLTSPTAAAVQLGPQNDELLSQLTSKRNAIVMLHARIRLLLTYLTDPPAGGHTPQLLRELKSLTHSRLPLLTPSNATTFEAEKAAEEADVNLVVLLGTLTKNIEQLRSVGRKFAAAETMSGGGGGGGGGKRDKHGDGHGGAPPEMFGRPGDRLGGGGGGGGGLGGALRDLGNRGGGRAY